MKIKSLSPWLALGLVVLSGSARADLEPFSFGASEAIKHDDNVTRGPSSEREGDWISTTEISAALDQALGRQRLTANGAFDVNRYKDLHRLDANTYSLAGALNWETVGDLSGAVGGDSARQQYVYGLNGEVLGPDGGTTRNLQTTNHLFANAQLGGLARWKIFAGADANERKYSNPLFEANEERQWSGHAGTSYSTSPDLSFGLQGHVTHGVYPNLILGSSHDDFDQKSLGLTTKWQISGVSGLDAALGYTRADYAEQPSNHFVNGSLNWTWSPPSHFVVLVGLSRDSSADTGISGAITANDSLTGRSINSVGHISATYELTAKTSLVANAQYTQRHYENAVFQETVPGIPVTINGSNRTTLFSLAAHFMPTRTTDLNCSVAHEVRHSDASVVVLAPSYIDNTVTCTASIKFD